MSTPVLPDIAETEGAEAITPAPPQQQAWNLAEPAPEEAVAASENIRVAVTSQSQTVGDIIDRVDSWAVPWGTNSVSVWDVLIVLLLIVAILAAAQIVARIAKASLRRINRLDNARRVLAEKLVVILVWGAAFLVGADLIGLDLTALAVFSGAFGLAIGFGLQKTFGNLVAGIILLMDKSIKPGDVIAVSDMSGRESFGQIRKIGIRAISVVTRDRKEYLIPNENLMVNQVENWSYSSREVRVKAPVGVSYDTDIELAEKLMHQAAKGAPRVLKEPPPRILLMGFGDSSIDFEIRFWITDPEEGVSSARSGVYKRLWHLFAEHGIEIPFPQREVSLRPSEELEEMVAGIIERVGEARRQTGDPQ